MKGGNFEFSAGTIWGTRNIIDACERPASATRLRQSMSVLDQPDTAAAFPSTNLPPANPTPKNRGLYTQTKPKPRRWSWKPPRKIAPRGDSAPRPDLRPRRRKNAALRYHRHRRPLAGGRIRQELRPLRLYRNVVDALLLAAASDVPNGAIFQLVDPAGIRQKDYVEWVRRSGRPVRASYVPAWFLKTAGLGVELLGKS